MTNVFDELEMMDMDVAEVSEGDTLKTVNAQGKLIPVDTEQVLMEDSELQELL